MHAKVELTHDSTPQSQNLCHCSISQFSKLILAGSGKSYVDLRSRIHCIYIREVAMLRGHRLEFFAGTEYRYLTTRWLLPRKKTSTMFGSQGRTKKYDAGVRR
jgi:hypothetical protein